MLSRLGSALATAIVIGIGMFVVVSLLLGREGVVALGPDDMMLDIAVLVGAVRHLVERQVRDLREDAVCPGEFVFEPLHISFHFWNAGLEARHFRHQRNLLVWALRKPKVKGSMTKPPL